MDDCFGSTSLYYWLQLPLQCTIECSNRNLSIIHETIIHETARFSGLDKMHYRCFSIFLLRTLQNFRKLQLLNQVGFLSAVFKRSMDISTLISPKLFSHEADNLHLFCWKPLEWSWDPLQQSCHYSFTLLKPRKEGGLNFHTHFCPGFWLPFKVFNSTCRVASYLFLKWGEMKNLVSYWPAQSSCLGLLMLIFNFMVQ